MKSICLGAVLCIAFNASALTINFTGELVTASSTGSYGFEVGDLFTGSAEFTGPTASAETFVNALISVAGAPDINFSTLTGSFFSPTRIELLSNSQGFSTTIALNMEGDSVAEGGFVSSRNDPIGLGWGSFSAAVYAEGKQNVPEAGSTLALLCLGLLPIAWRHEVRHVIGSLRWRGR